MNFHQLILRNFHFQAALPIHCCHLRPAYGCRRLHSSTAYCNACMYLQILETSPTPSGSQHKCFTSTWFHRSAHSDSKNRTISDHHRYVTIVLKESKLLHSQQVHWTLSLILGPFILVNMVAVHKGTNLYTPLSAIFYLH